MKKFFAFVTRQTVAVILAVAFIIGFGAFSAGSMAINLLPDINVPMVCVQIIYPGANAPSVESDITAPVEEGLSSLAGVEKVQSYSYDNLSAVVFSFGYGTDADDAKSEIQSKISAMDLPDTAQVSVYDIDLNAQALAVVSVTSENGETEDEKLDSAYKKANELAGKMAAKDGVERVEVKGGADKAFAVRPFAGFELFAPLIVEAFSYGALDIPLGNIGDGGEIQVRNNSDIKSPDDIAVMPVTLTAENVGSLYGIKSRISPFIQKKPGESESEEYDYDGIIKLAEQFYKIKFSREFLEFLMTDERILPAESAKPIVLSVGDIAQISYEPEFSSYVYYADGVKIVKGAVIEVYKANGANSSAVVNRIKSVYRSDGDEGFTFALLDDQSSFISDSVSNVLISMLIGGALAVVVIFAFLKKWRTSLIIAVTMPLSVLASLICLYLMGITLNMVSLGGLAVGIGMLVDNSIVVIECISKHRDAGKTAREAAVDGACEVGGALFGSTLTTVCVFIPIIFSGGLTAEIFTDLAFAVIFSLSFSLIVALTVIPTLYALFTSGRKKMLTGGAFENAQTEPTSKAAEVTPEEGEPQKPEKARKPFGQRLAALRQPVIMSRVEKAYSKILPAVLGKKLVTILVAVALFGASIGLLFLTGTEFLPSIDKGQIEVNVSYPASTQLSEVEQDVFGLSEYLQENVKDVDYMSISVGKNGLLALTDSGIITVQLKTNRRTYRKAEEIRGLLEQYSLLHGNAHKRSATVREIDGVVASLMSGSTDMSVTIVGDDEEILSEIAAKIEAKLKERSFEDITDTSTGKSTQYTLEFDRAKIAAAGLDYQTVALTLRIGMASYTACTFETDGEVYNLKVAFDKDAVKDKSDLENFAFGATAEGGILRLKDLLKPDSEGNFVREEQVDTCIRRSDGRKMISISATLPGSDTGSASEKMSDIASSVLKEYDGYGFEASGISSYLSDAFRGLAVALVVSFFLLYAVMAVQFGSAVKPLIIMASIPFSFTGGFLALVITGSSLNVVSFIGLIMLMGVVVNNAIVMLEKIKQLKDGGMSHYDSVLSACRERLRPILMTTLTTILALIPLAIGVGAGSELMQPLGITVIGGLLIGTMVTLVLVPCVYCAVNRISKKYPDGKKGKRPSAEDAREESAQAENA